MIIVSLKAELKQYFDIDCEGKLRSGFTVACKRLINLKGG